METSCAPLPWAVFEGWLPKKVRAEATEATHTKQKAKKTSKDDLVSLYPWLSILDDREGFQAPPESSSSPASSGARRPLGDLDEDEIAAVWDELEAARAMLESAAAPASPDDIRAKPLGGPLDQGAHRRWCRCHPGHLSH